MGFGGCNTFSIMEAIFPIVFLTIFGIIIFTVIKGIAEWNKNNHSPRLTVPAAVITKRTSVSSNRTGAGSTVHHHTHSTSYYVTFEVESGDRMELHVDGREYGMLAEGDVGMLSFQGTRYLGFERK